jgi:hypothetical protein
MKDDGIHYWQGSFTEADLLQQELVFGALAN